MTCYFHPDKIATHTDCVVDLDKCGIFSIAYKRVGICWMCAQERKRVNTSRVEPMKRVLVVDDPERPDWAQRPHHTSHGTRPRIRRSGVSIPPTLHCSKKARHYCAAMWASGWMKTPNDRTLVVPHLSPQDFYCSARALHLLELFTKLRSKLGELI